jgi:hypothetical protein
MPRTCHRQIWAGPDVQVCHEWPLRSRHRVRWKTGADRQLRCLKIRLNQTFLAVYHCTITFPVM